MANEPNEPKGKPLQPNQGNYIGLGTAIGVWAGTAIGIATDNLGLWVAIGAALGVALGFAFGSARAGR